MRFRARTVTVAFAVITACRTVDPGPDYDRAADEIRRVTGVTNVYRPDSSSDQVDGRVQELLEDGLSLTEAVELGLLNSPVLQASFHAVGMANADRVQAGLLTNPSLNGVLRLPTSGGPTGFEGSLFASLLDLWQLPDRERVAEQALEQQILQLAHDAALLAAEIRGAFIESVSAEQLLAIAAENRAIAANLAELSSARLEAAAATAIDANLANLELATASIALRDAELAVMEAKRRLSMLLGLKSDSELHVQPFEQLPHIELLPVEELERLALEGRLDIRAAESALARADAELERQRGLTWRGVDVGVGAEKDEDWALGPALRLDLPLFDQNQAQVAKALEERHRREKILVATTIAALQEVRSASARLAADMDALAIYRDQMLTRAEETLEQARSSYRVGKTTILPVIEAQRQVLQARRDYVRRVGQAARALSDVERATGAPRETLFERKGAQRT